MQFLFGENIEAGENAYQLGLVGPLVCIIICGFETTVKMVGEDGGKFVYQNYHGVCLM